MIYLGVSLSDSQVLAHINVIREQLILFGVDDWEGVDRYQYFVTLTVNSNGIIEVLVFIVRSELNVYVLGDPRRHHPLLIVLYLEVGRAGREYAESLRGRRVIDQSHAKCVGLQGLKTCEFHH